MALDKETLKKAQRIMDQNDVDFAPMALDYLVALQTNIEEVRNANDTSRAAIDKLLEPIVELKSNASMFNYPLVGVLANITMSFLEGLNTLDDDILAIVEAHQKSLHLIVKKRMQGNAANYGDELEKELRDACKRYFQKQARKGTSI